MVGIVYARIDGRRSETLTVRMAAALYDAVMERGGSSFTRQVLGEAVANVAKLNPKPAESDPPQPLRVSGRGVSPYRAEGHPPTELGFARTVIALHGKDLAWFPARKQWAKRKGRKWVPITSAYVDSLVCRVVSEYYDAITASGKELSNGFYMVRDMRQRDSSLRSVVRRIQNDPY